MQSMLFIHATFSFSASPFVLCLIFACGVIDAMRDIPIISMILSQNVLLIADFTKLMAEYSNCKLNCMFVFASLFSLNLPT